MYGVFLKISISILLSIWYHRNLHVWLILVSCYWRNFLGQDAYRRWWWCWWWRCHPWRHERALRLSLTFIACTLLYITANQFGIDSIIYKGLREAQNRGRHGCRKWACCYSFQELSKLLFKDTRLSALENGDIMKRLRKMMPRPLSLHSIHLRSCCNGSGNRTASLGGPLSANRAMKMQRTLTGQDMSSASESFIW